MGRCKTKSQTRHRYLHVDEEQVSRIGTGSAAIDSTIAEGIDSGVENRRILVNVAAFVNHRSTCVLHTVIIGDTKLPKPGGKWNRHEISHRNHIAGQPPFRANILPIIGCPADRPATDIQKFPLIGSPDSQLSRIRC